MGARSHDDAAAEDDSADAEETSADETEETSVATAPMNITISMERSDGNSIYLFAEDMELNSSEKYSFQWQVSPDNEQWINVEGANDPEYNFTLDQSNNNSYWRLLITEKGNSNAVTG